MTFSRSYMQRHSVTPQQLISEGIVELGRIGSVAFVLTRAKLHLFHSDAIPRLDSPNTPVPEDLRISVIDVG